MDAEQLLTTALEAAMAAAQAMTPEEIFEEDPVEDEIALRLEKDRGVTSRAIQAGLKSGAATERYGMCLLLTPEGLTWPQKMRYITTLHAQLESAGMRIAVWMPPVP